MAIDECEYSFSILAEDKLPRHMSALRLKMKNPASMKDFDVAGVGPAALARKYGFQNDFKGCYVFVEEIRPIYVGISRTVLRRLRQHVKGQTHFDASLAYRMATADHPHQLTRHDAMTMKDFRTAFEQAQEYLRRLSVAFVEIQNPLELYLFEAYCAMELDTSIWNTFATH